MMILVPLDGWSLAEQILPYARVFAVIAMSTHDPGSGVGITKRDGESHSSLQGPGIGNQALTKPVGFHTLRSNGEFSAFGG